MDMTVAQVMKQILKDEVFYYHSGGGVTLSGGDVLLQAEFASELLKECRDNGIHTMAELDMYGDFSKVELLLPHLNALYIDIKHMNSRQHKDWTGADNAIILKNIKKTAAYFAAASGRAPRRGPSCGSREGASTRPARDGHAMNLSHLRYFVKLAELQHYAQAARDLYITQPSLTHAIKALEAELGVPLFQRQGRGVRLTRFGSEFNECVMRGLQEIDRGVELARERRGVLDVDEVAALERAVAEDGTPLAELMDRAGRAVADEVRAWVPDPAPVVVLSGSGNNGGDGWVAAPVLAEAGYPVTLVAPDLAERLHAEPARSTALETFARAAEDCLPLSVLIAPDADVLADAVDEAEAVVDALLGTGFSGGEVREPYAGWIRAANRRRFEGKRGKGRGRHRKRTHERGEHERPRRSLPAKAKDAPFAVAADVPSGLSAQTGAAARPTFAADATVTMLAYKPGLVASAGAPWVGAVKLAKLGVDASKYLEAEERA